MKNSRLVLLNGNGEIGYIDSNELTELDRIDILNNQTHMIQCDPYPHSTDTVFRQNGQIRFHSFTPVPKLELIDGRHKLA